MMVTILGWWPQGHQPRMVTIIYILPGSTQSTVQMIRTCLGGHSPRIFPLEFTMGWPSLSKLGSGGPNYPLNIFRGICMYLRTFFKNDKEFHSLKQSLDHFGDNERIHLNPWMTKFLMTDLDKIQGFHRSIQKHPESWVSEHFDQNWLFKSQKIPARA